MLLQACAHFNSQVAAANAIASANHHLPLRTVVPQHAHGLCAVPRGEGICGEARVHQGHVRGKALVLQVQVVQRHLRVGDGGMGQSVNTVN